MMRMGVWSLDWNQDPGDDDYDDDDDSSCFPLEKQDEYFFVKLN